MSLGSHNNTEFVEMIKEILIELDLPEVLKIAKFNTIENNNQESIASTSYRASEEIDYRDFGSYYEENDEQYNITYEYDEEHYDVNYEENEENYEVMLSSDLSFNSAYKLLDYLEKNGINVTVKKFRKHFDKWIRKYPDLKDLYRNVLSVNNFCKYDQEKNETNTKTNTKTNNKIVKIIENLNKTKIKEEKLILNSLEKLRITANN